MKHVPPPSGKPLGGLDNLAMAVPPRWGEAVLRLAKATERVAAKLDELPSTTADVQYIPKARELAKSLIDFLDGLEDTDQDTACDDAACDDDELDGPENGEDEESEPDEPSLGSLTSSEWSNQETWGTQPLEMRTVARVDLEDEHDGAEPDEDGEPSLGSLDRQEDQQYAWAPGSCVVDGEIEDDTGIGDDDGLLEQIGSQDWQKGGMI
ncbi:hypothetical protein [Bradyrhizobium erythrophlei]|uniref:Uncharacterized protein n=1 Tax=Bradyrhizobium erythrophlei TaxID=1437360 RepID=A0A1M7T733_9BRAD|nr:hypothetical protein [Bradyrhizobium erythrophlei]SHN66551.1 hypothetical protein SAMN05444170_0984 [Bradyrhizobium erythrophlei]